LAFGRSLFLISGCIFGTFILSPFAVVENTTVFFWFDAARLACYTTFGFSEAIYLPLYQENSIEVLYMTQCRCKRGSLVTDAGQGVSLS
jgi:hypothetical protein